MDMTMEEDVSLVQELAPLHDNVEYMEDRLTAQAIALEEQKKLDRMKREEKRVSLNAGKYLGPRRSEDVSKLLKTIKQEISDALEQEERNLRNMEDDDDDDIAEIIRGLDITESEIFDIGSVIITDKFVDALRSGAVVNSVLGKVSGLTNTRLTQEGDRYLLSGKLEDLLGAKKLLLKAIIGQEESEQTYSDSEEEEEVEEIKKPVKKSRKGRPKASATKKSQKNQAKTKGNKTKPKVEKEKENKKSVEASKKGKVVGKKQGESFPYSEIKEIIEASKQTKGEVKRKRGRPAKKLPAPKQASAGNTREVAKVMSPKTPSRYGTRGVKRDYKEMSSGMIKVKEEVDDQVNDYEEMPAEDEEEIVEVVDETELANNEKGKRGKDVNSDAEDKEEGSEGEEENEKAGTYLDDSEQEELDQMSSDNEDDGDAAREIRRNEKITDDTVQNLKTSNVSTSVPLISKVGIRKVSCQKRKPKKDIDVAQEVETIADTVKVDSLKCSLCDEHKAATFADLTEHLMTFHHVYEPPRCDVCELDLDNNRSLTQHIEVRHGPKREASFPCQEPGCNKVLSSLAVLRSHVNSLHNGVDKAKEKKYTCEKCQYKSNSIEDLYEHKKIAHDMDIHCELCNKTFQSYQSLKTHNELKHTNNQQKMCTICNKEFSDPAYLKRHMKYHTGALSCTVCKKVVVTKSSLTAHMETHKPEEERNYKHVCPYCGKRFLLKPNYEDHLNKHTGNRPYKCNLCDKSFGFRSMLKKHKTFVHSTDRPFKCGICMKGFKFMNLLKNHVTVHTNESKHVCPRCSKCFSTAATLRLHFKKCGNTQQPAYMKVRPGESLLNRMDYPYSMVGFTEQTVASQLKSSDLATPYDQTVDSEIVPSVGNVVTAPPAAPDEVELEPVSDEVSAAGQVSEIEMYACSECKSTFRTFEEAEVHVLTAHSQPAAN